MKKLKLAELKRLSEADYAAAPKFPVILVADRIRSGHNVGSFFRTADGFRLEKVILCGYSARPPHTEIYKTALGAEDTVVWEEFPTAAAAILHYKSLGYRAIGLEQTTGSISLETWNPAPDGKWLVVVGNEVDGVAQDALECCDTLVEIPQFGTKHSLNVSIATGIILWEIMRSKLA